MKDKTIKVTHVAGRTKQVEVEGTKKKPTGIKVTAKLQSLRRTIDGHTVRLMELEDNRKHMIERMQRDSSDIDGLCVCYEALKKKTSILTAISSLISLAAIALAVVALCNN